MGPLPTPGMDTTAPGLLTHMEAATASRARLRVPSADDFSRRRRLLDAHGKRRRGSADSRESASARKAAEEARASLGEHDGQPSRAKATLADYARELLGADADRPAGERPLRGRYQGR